MNDYIVRATAGNAQIRAFAAVTSLTAKKGGTYRWQKYLFTISKVKKLIQSN